MNENSNIEFIKDFIADLKKSNSSPYTLYPFNYKLEKSLTNIIEELEKKEKIIVKMAEYLEDNLTDELCYKDNCYADEYKDGHCQKCVNCIKEYFEKK